MYKQMIPADVVARRPQVHHPPARMNDASPAPAAGANELAVLQNELTEQRNRYLRLAADFENFRRRTARESEQRAATQKFLFIGELLRVLDDLERALAKADTGSAEPVREGVQLILQQVVQLLRQHGFETREELGQPFDPKYHHAVGTRGEVSRPDRTILEVWQRGWLCNGSLFRPAKVVVNVLDHRCARNQSTS